MTGSGGATQRATSSRKGSRGGAAADHPWRMQSMSSKSERSKYETAPPASKPNAPWKRRMPVAHPSFGVGIIEKVDHKSGDEYYLTINFKAGTKKVLSRFVTKV
jgi:hypothetical protein